jgi:hypothetical protein
MKNRYFLKNKCFFKKKISITIKKTAGYWGVAFFRFFLIEKETIKKISTNE